MADIPSPDTLHPVAGHPRVVFLKPLVRSPNIEVGDYTYYDDPGAFERENVLYAYGPERLVIGRYCALATGVRFLMAGATTRPLASPPSPSPSSVEPGPSRHSSWCRRSRAAAIPSPVTMSGSATKRWSCRVSGSVTARSSRPRRW
jgi:hypothetical protein